MNSIVDLGWSPWQIPFLQVMASCLVRVLTPSPDRCDIMSALPCGNCESYPAYLPPGSTLHPVRSLLVYRVFSSPVIQGASLRTTSCSCGERALTQRTDVSHHSTNRGLPECRTTLALRTKVVRCWAVRKQMPSLLQRWSCKPVV